MKIVIVEDENSIRNGLSGILPKLNMRYQVVGTAANGREGLEAIARTRPDLVIMDIHMPEMDGLTMLSHLREQGVLCRVVVLTAYSDFSYAKRAIELNIDNYLLKPIKIPELKNALESVQESLNEETGKEKLREQLLSLEQIFRASILAELPIDENLNLAMREKYGLDVNEPLALFSVWLDRRYDELVGAVERALEEYTGRATDYRCCVIRFSRQQMVGVILYNLQDVEKIRKRYEKLALSTIRRIVDSDQPFNWEECENLNGIADAFTELKAKRRWNLSFPDGTVISPQLLAETEVAVLKYPLDIDAMIRQAVASENEKIFSNVVEFLVQSCRNGVHQPEEIREAWIRFSMGVMTLARNTGKTREPLATQEVAGRLTQAVTWQEIRETVKSMYRMILTEETENTSVSLMVKRASQMIGEYYNQGITLEELAQKLCVSEEYLSTQFKKETGVSFKDTVKKYRIDKIRELLLHSSLKLNQIADMVGYSDPKYMSKVFKDEVGMLPAEFRKIGQ